MLNLIKYELLRRQKLLLIALVVLVLIQGGILFGLYKGGGFVLLSLMLFFLLIYGSLIMVIVDTIRCYSIDLNQTQGYMLFLTPNSGHKIILSKIITAVIILTVVSAIVYGFTYWDFNVVKTLYFDALEGELAMVFDMYGEMYRAAVPNFFSTILLVLQMLIEFLGFVIAIIFSITVRKTLLAQTKFGGLVSFVIFLVVISVMGTVNFLATLITGTFGGYMDMVMEMASSEIFDVKEFGKYISRMVAIEATMNLIYIGVFTFFSGKLLNKRVDL